MWTHTGAVAATALLVLGGTAGSALARPRDTDLQTHAYAAGSSATLEGVEARPRRPGPTGGGQPARARRAVPACPGNDPNIAWTGSTTGGTRLICPGAIAMCAHAPGSFLFLLFVGPPGVSEPQPGQWTRQGQQCLVTAPPPAPGTAALTASDLRRLPLPPATIGVQPATRVTMTGLPLRLLADTRSAVITTRLLGRPVRVAVRPLRLRWTFGDGTESIIDVPPSRPDPRPTIGLHTFRSAGVHRLELTTTYTGTYSIAGGPWMPIDGFATVATPPLLITVRSRMTELVGSPDARPH